MAVRSTTRHGTRRLIIDIVWKRPDGSRGRYRRDALVQTADAARAEDRRRLAALVRTGLPDDLGSPEAHPANTSGLAPLFADVVEDYLGDYAQSRLKPSTRYSYENILRHLLLPWFGKLRIDSIDARRIYELDADLERKGRTRGTRRNVQLVLRSVLCRFCVEHKLLAQRPELPRPPRVGRSVRRALTDAEVERLLAAIREPYKLAFLLAAYAGMRASEVRGLRWRHVHLDEGYLVVEDSICRGVTDVPKSGHERRIPLQADLRAALAAVANRPRNGYVTHRSDGAAWSEDALGKAFKTLCTKLGIEGVSLHSLRHYFVTTLFRRGVGAPTVQALAGHLHLATTQRYAHALDSDLEDAIARFRGNGVVTATK